MFVLMVHLELTGQAYSIDVEHTQRKVCFPQIRGRTVAQQVGAALKTVADGLGSIRVGDL